MLIGTFWVVQSGTRKGTIFRSASDAERFGRLHPGTKVKKEIRRAPRQVRSLPPQEIPASHFFD